MITYTIHITQTTMIAREGRSKGARRVYHAPGLEIFVVGACDKKRIPELDYNAMRLAQDNHIPLISLRVVGRATGKKELPTQPDLPTQKELF